VFVHCFVPEAASERIWWSLTSLRPITVAARSKAWTVFAHSNPGIVGSNFTQGRDVCVRLFCVYVVLCVGSGLATGWSPSNESYRLCIGLRNWKKAAEVQQKDCRAIDRYVEHARYARNAKLFRIIYNQYLIQRYKMLEGKHFICTLLFKCYRVFRYI
jgi:hypothetical protein